MHLLPLEMGVQTIDNPGEGFPWSLHPEITAKGRLVNRSFSIFIFGLLCAALSGCGGGNEPEVEKAKPEPGIVARGVVKPAEAPNPGGRPMVRRPAEEPKPTTKVEQKEPVKHAIDPNADPRDVFVIGGSGFHFDDGGPATEAEPTDQFAAVLPVTNDPTSFIATFPEREIAKPEKPANLPAGFTPIPSDGFTEGGLPKRVRCEKDGAMMVLVPAGTSTMGTNNGPSEARPQLSVYLDNFYIDVAEVTVAQYEEFRKEMKEEKKRNIQEPVNIQSPPDHPVLGVPYTEAAFYANRSGKDLPNEAEWEKAARGEKGFEFAWGSGRPVWSRTRTVDQIDPIKSFRTDRSVFDVYDLAGNAQEWCSDFYMPTHYAELAESGTVIRNWRGPRRTANDNIRVVRGGGPNWESWSRRGLSAREHDPKVGFRCVLRLNAAPAKPDAPMKSDTPARKTLK